MSFFLILLSLQRVQPIKTALKSQRGQAHMNEKKLSATFTLQRKNSDASISRQQLCNNHRKFSSDFKCSSIAGYGKPTERLKKSGTNRYLGLHECRLRLIVTSGSPWLLCNLLESTLTFFVLKLRKINTDGKEMKVHSLKKCTTRRLMRFLFNVQMSKIVGLLILIALLR